MLEIMTEVLPWVGLVGYLLRQHLKQRKNKADLLSLITLLEKKQQTDFSYLKEYLEYKPTKRVSKKGR